MSYDVWLECPCCGDAKEDCLDLNFTSNISPMFYNEDVNINPKEWDGWLAGEVVDELERGINALMSNPDKYKAMNPESGWGDYDTLLNHFLKPILVALYKHPHLMVRVSA